MPSIVRKISLLSLGGAALILSGCASTDAVQHAQSTADQALTTAQQAQQTAQQALTTAQQAQQSADQNHSSIEQMQQTQMQPHRGPRG